MAQGANLFSRRDNRYRLYDEDAVTLNYVDVLFVQDPTLPLIRPRGEEELVLNQDRADACMGYQQISDLPIFEGLAISIQISEHVQKAAQALDMFSNPRRLNPWEINGQAITPVTTLGTTVDLDNVAQPHISPCDPQRQDLVNLERLKGPPLGADSHLTRYLGVGFDAADDAQGQPDSLTFNGFIYGQILLRVSNDFSAGADLFP